MKSPITELIETVGLDTLTPLVRQSQRNSALAILDWRSQPLTGGSTTAGVYRILGTATDQNQLIAWSLALKILPSPSLDDRSILAPHENPANSTYWKREFLVYTSDLLDGLPPGFAAPRCFLAEEKEGVCWLWLEDIGDIQAARWGVEHFGVAARHLGRFNGSWMGERGLPSHRWLNNSFVRERAYRSQMSEQEIRSAIEALRQDPQLRIVWSEQTVSNSLCLLTDREMFLQTLEKLPKTFQHQDTGRKNLSIRSEKANEATTVAIDWGFAGIGALGGDLASLIISSMRWFGGVQPSQLPAMEQIAFEGYLQGLSEAGWDGDPQLVRLGYLLTSSMMFGPTWVDIINDPPDVRAWIESVFQHPFNELVWRLSEVNQHVVAQAEEARQLMRSL